METEVEMCDREGVCLEGGSGGLICFYSFFFCCCLFAKTLKEETDFLEKKMCILGDNFSFLLLKLQRTNLVVQVLL